MKIKYHKPVFKYYNTKHYITISLTMDEANYIKDYLEIKIENNPVGILKKGLEKILK